MALKGFLQGEHGDLGSGYNSGLATKGAQYSNALHSAHIALRSDLIGRVVHPSTLGPKITNKYVIINMQ